MEEEKGLLRKIMDLRNPKRYQLSTPKLEDMFCKAGRNDNSFILIYKNSGKKRVFAFIRFKTEEEANSLEEDHEVVVEYKYRFPDLDQNGTQDPFLNVFWS